MYKHLAWMMLLATAVSLTATGIKTAAAPAQAIVDKAIRRHGGRQSDQVRIDFDFRQYHLSIGRKDGRFDYRRTCKDSPGHNIAEQLTNDSFTRRINGQPQSLSEAGHRKYHEAVNAVVYLSLLPFRLNDAGAMRQYPGRVESKGSFEEGKLVKLSEIENRNIVVDPLR